MSRHLVNVLDTVAQHTPGRLVAMPKPGPTFSDHGWRTIAMCGPQQMIAAKYEQVCEIEDGIVVSTRWDHEANARRLVACWNACDGMPTEDVEQYASVDRGVMRIVVLADDYRIQRDELLAALECAVALADKNKADREDEGFIVERPPEMQASYDRCVAAIAKVRGAA